MVISETIKGLQERLFIKRNMGSIGFVPTMGALHKGHISLVKQSVKENHTTVVSIYVNPAQFNDKNDLEQYPRDIKRDLQLLETTGCDIIFVPSNNEMYPEPDNRTFNFGYLETVMEGRHRPGHFNGVGQIVSKLFDAVMPDKAYFGLKDFQQIAIIKKLVKDYNYPIKIVSCTIIREPDGLAMSSRNVLLKPEMRKSAAFINKTLQEVVIISRDETIPEIKKFVKIVFENLENLNLEYFEIVDDNTLQPISEFDIKIAATACIAVYAGKVRLIDNVQFNS